jgi:hypothetical protein
MDIEAQKNTLLASQAMAQKINHRKKHKKFDKQTTL